MNDNKNIIFSIIIPVYKVEKYIRRCIDSIINQTFKDIEIILVDDGSPDACPEICDEYAKKDDRIKVIHKKNGGLSDARNYGTQAASGEYIIFVDSDDYIALDTCEKFVKYTSNGYDIIVGNAYVIGQNQELIHQFEYEGNLSGKEYLKQSLQRKDFLVAAWLNVYKKEFLEKNNLKFKVGILHEDVDFTPRAFLYAKNIIVTKEVFYYYIIREDSITTQKDKRKNAKDLYQTCCIHEKIYSKIKDIELKQLMLNYLVHSYLCLYYEAKLYRYGKEFVHKEFCLRNSFERKTILKSKLFSISPRLYCYVNDMLKKIKN